MAMDLNSLLFDPRLNFLVSMMSAGAPSKDPRSSSLAWALSQGLLGAQGATQAYGEMQNHQAYSDLQRQYMQQRQAEAERKSAMERAQSNTLAGMLTPPAPQVVGQTTEVPGLPPSNIPMKLYGPPDAEQQKQQALARIRQLAQTDPNAAMEMLKAMNKGEFPGIPAPQENKVGQRPWYTPLLPQDQLPQAARVAAGLEPRAANESKAPWYMEGVEEGSPEWDRAQKIARGVLPRASVNSGGGGGGEGDLTKSERNQRIAITRARKTIAKMGMDRKTAEALAEKDAGFKATLEMANKRMPGSDPAWETTMQRRSKNAATGGKSPEQWQADYDATSDPYMKQSIKERAARKGIILKEKEQPGFFQRLFR